MPPIEEVRHYLRGIVLLVRQNPAGFRWLDLTDRGLQRSFWAIAWCFPLMIPNWVWWHGLFTVYGPVGAETGLLFYVRMAVIEISLWFLPYLTIGAVMAWRGLAPRFDAMVIAMNWLNVPVYILTAAIALLEILIPAPLELWYYVIQLQLVVVIAAQFSVFFVLAQKNWFNAIAMTAASIIPSMFASVWLNSFLNVSIGS